jgi:hypothetical protein
MLNSMILDHLVYKELHTHNMEIFWNVEHQVSMYGMEELV